MATSATAPNRAANRETSTVLQNILGTNVVYPTGISLTNATAAHVAIVDGTGAQITTFGGSSASVGTTGAAVPASADYIGANKAGNLTGILMGSQTGANSLAVVLASDQAALAVTGTFFQATQPISAVSLPLPTGAAQDATLTGGTQQSKITDGTNIVNVLKSDGTAAGQNAQIVAGGGMTTATLTLNSGSPNTAWFDMLNYAWVSIEILTNTTPATLNWQTTGDAAQTNASSMGLITATGGGNSIGTNTNSATGMFHGPRAGRYFRITSNVAGGNSVTLVITFSTVASGSVGISAGQSGTWTVGSNSATAATVPANAFYEAGIAKTSLPTATSDGQLTGVMTDKFGRQVVIPQGMRDIVLPITRLVLTTSTTETSLIAAVASTFNDILELVIVNTSATGCLVDFRDSTGGTIRHTIYVPPTDTRGIVCQVPTPQAAVNTAWTAQCGTSVTSIIITGKYIANK